MKVRLRHLPGDLKYNGDNDDCQKNSDADW
jgi:hypothetical protein